MEIYVWGTGCGAGELIDTALPAERVTAFVESSPAQESFLGKPILSPEELANRAYDLVIVTGRGAEAIAERCAALGIDGEKLLFLKNHTMLADRNRCYPLAAELLGADFVERLKQSQRLIRAPRRSARECLPPEELDNDYVRLKTLELLCRQIAEVPGAAAELGVYRGGFARCINLLLPERRLYLFDTFSGFNAEEAAGYGAGFVNAHRNTAEERVRAILPHPERAVFRRGLFPATAQGLEERFALVSLDADLEESCYQGLRWFLPRLNPGGYLLLHDYDNPDLPGVRAALARYAAETGERLCTVPLCDVNGTLVICGQGPDTAGARRLDQARSDSTK